MALVAFHNGDSRNRYYLCLNGHRQVFLDRLITGDNLQCCLALCNSHCRIDNTLVVLAGDYTDDVLIRRTDSVLLVVRIVGYDFYVRCQHDLLTFRHVQRGDLDVRHMCPDRYKECCAYVQVVIAVVCLCYYVVVASIGIGLNRHGRSASGTCFHCKHFFGVFPLDFRSDGMLWSKRPCEVDYRARIASLFL